MLNKEWFFIRNTATRDQVDKMTRFSFDMDMFLGSDIWGVCRVIDVAAFFALRLNLTMLTNELAQEEY